MADNGQGDQRSSTLRSVALATGFGCSVVTVLGLLVGGGLLLDQQRDSAPLWTLIGIALGLVAIVTEFAFLIRSSRRESTAATRVVGRRARPIETDPDEEQDRPAGHTDNTR